MKRLPNFENEVIDIRKLQDYCLNPDHPVGKHKARVFHSELGLCQEHVGILKESILTSLSKNNAHVKFKDKYGTRYTVNIKIRILGQEKTVTAGWIIKNNETFPRLITCYLNTKNH